MALSSMSASCLLGLSVGPIGSLGRPFALGVFEEETIFALILKLIASQTSFHLPYFILCLLKNICDTLLLFLLLFGLGTVSVC